MPSAMRETITLRIKLVLRYRNTQTETRHAPLADMQLKLGACAPSRHATETWGMRLKPTAKLKAVSARQATCPTRPQKIYEDTLAVEETPQPPQYDMVM